MTIKEKTKAPSSTTSTTAQSSSSSSSTTIVTANSETLATAVTNNSANISSSSSSSSSTTLSNQISKFTMPSNSTSSSSAAPLVPTICRNTTTNMTFKHWPASSTTSDDGGGNSSVLLTSDSIITPNKHHHYHHNQYHHHHQQLQQQLQNIDKGGNGGNSHLNVGGSSSVNYNNCSRNCFNSVLKRNDKYFNVLNNARLTTTSSSVTSDCGGANSSEHRIVHHHHHHHHHDNNDDSNENVHSSGSCIKSSLSMTSLPPPANESHQENKEVIKAKLRLERPYNSLKKKRNSDRDTWRHSWGSGHSQSSCSLHSNATGIIGKDEFWAALQTNYNYIMDTNLLDTCREARYEIEGTTAANLNPIDCCGKMLLQSPRTEAISEDPRELRKWLRDMENKLSTAPSLLEATQLSIDELQKRLNDHSVLYCEIVSHARVVGACIKAATVKSTITTTTTTEKNICETTATSDNNYSLADNSFNSLSSAEDKSPLKGTNATNAITDNNLIANEISTVDSGINNKNSLPIVPSTKRLDNLKSLERRYHLLYLKAIEVQCLFEGLLKKKNSENILNEDYLSNGESESDDEPVSKLARLSDSECNNIRDLNTSFGNTLDENILCHHPQTNSDYIKSEEDFEDGELDIIQQTVKEVDEVDCSLDFIREWQNYSFNTSNNTTSTTNNIKTSLKKSDQLHLNDSYTEFDADSEGSDSEEILSLKKRHKRVISSAGCIGKRRHPSALSRRLSHSPFNNIIKPRNEFFNLSDFEKIQPKIQISGIQNVMLNNTMDNTINTSGSGGGGVVGTPLLQHNTVVVQNTTVYDCNRNSPNSSQDKKLFATKNTNQNLNRSPNSISIGINTSCNLKSKISPKNTVISKDCIDENNLLDICNGNSSSCGGSIIGPQRVSTPIISSTKLNINKRQRNGDASKFNRSNRKSKNCAIFYFKHLDTDNETNFGLSSQGENELINGEPTSSGDDEDPMEDDFDDDEADEIDDGWLYTNNNNDGSTTNKSAIIVSNTVSDLMNGNGGNNDTTINTIEENHHRHHHQLSADDSDKENKEIVMSNEQHYQKNTNGGTIETNNHNHRDANGNIQEHRPSPIRSTVSAVTNNNFITKSEIQYHKFPSAPRMITTTTVTTIATANTAELIIIENSDNECQKEEQQKDELEIIDRIEPISGVENSANLANTSTATITASSISTGTSSTDMTQINVKEESFSTSNHDSIKQLVLDAENLVREDCMRTPTKKSNHRNTKTPRSLKTLKASKSTIKKRDHPVMSGSNIQKVHEWLEHQPISPKKEQRNFVPTTDCEASGENTESDNGGHHESDTSEGLTDSVATCMQTGGSTSHCTSTEIIGGSAEPILPHQNGSNLSLNGKVIRRTIQNRRNSDRPWSVSCLSQLTTNGNSTCSVINTTKSDDVQSGLATHSISESALHVLASPTRNCSMANKNSPHQTPVKNSDSKNSLKRKKIRRRKQSSSTKKSDSGSEGLQAYDLPKLTESLINTEKISTEQMTIIKDLSAALSMIQLPKSIGVHSKHQNFPESQESDEDVQRLTKPNFKIGPYTSSHMANEAKLGSLAALANYMNEEAEGNAGTDEHNSSFSEQAWDNYQEKYNSENYSEGFDSDAARRLLEFGDDYRAFLDSQSDCCSSLSAANNLDSLSPPRMDSLTNNQPSEVKLTQETITSSVVDHARRRRALELEYERRRRTLEMKRKSSQDNIIAINNSPCSPAINSSTSSANNAITPKNNDSTTNRVYPRCAAVEAASRRLDFDAVTSTSVSSVPLTTQQQSGIHYKRTSESDTSLRRRKHSEDSVRRRSRNLEKAFKVAPHSSASSLSNSDSEDEKEMNNLLQQSRNRLEDTEALKIRSHLLRPEDYTEIIATCRDNINCLNTVLHGPPATVLTAGQQNQIRELLSSWEIFLAWSENAGTARKMQEEMFVLKNMLNRLGCKQLTDLDSESSIQLSIEELKNEKSDLQAYRTNMLRLNASVHSWLTRQEMKVRKELKALKESNDLKLQQQQQKQQIENGNIMETKNLIEGEPQHKQQSDVVVMNAETQSLDNIIQSENEFHKHLKDEVSEMYKAWDEADARINTKLETLQGSLNAWRQLENGLSEFHQVLGKDRGTLEGLEGALENGRSTCDLAQNVKLVAKLLSERVDNAKQQIAQVAEEQQIDPHQLIHITRFAASNGSLSDSGISDGGTTSDGGLSERERRLGVLRRLAKQLESALAPGSEALKSISARMEAAEAELKKLQTTCREIIVRTAVQQQNKATATLSQQQQAQEQLLNQIKLVQKPVSVGSGVEDISPSKSAKKRKARKLNKNGSNPNLGDSDSANNDLSDSKDESKKAERRNKTNRKMLSVSNGGSGDPDDPRSDTWDVCNSSDDESEGKRSWSWRVARVALPMQLALLTLFCAACLMQPHCCDSFNNFSMSFTPQLRYVRGPPPI